MENIEAAKLIVKMYGEWRKHYSDSEQMNLAVALAIGALRKDSERK